MIEENQLAVVGKFFRTHALKGELNATLDIDPVYFEDGNPLIVDVEGAFVPFYMESVRSKGQSGYLIRLDGIESADDARYLVNKAIMAEKSVLKEYLAEEGEEMMMESDLIGFEVEDIGHGILGTLARIDDSTVNLLFIVDTPEGEEVYIPATDEYIVEIDEANRKVKVSLPLELIDLNRTSVK